MSSIHRPKSGLDADPGPTTAPSLLLPHPKPYFRTPLTRTLCTANHATASWITDIRVLPQDGFPLKFLTEQFAQQARDEDQQCFGFGRPLTRRECLVDAEQEKFHQEVRINWVSTNAKHRRFSRKNAYFLPAPLREKLLVEMAYLEPDFEASDREHDLEQEGENDGTGAEDKADSELGLPHESDVLYRTNTFGEAGGAGMRSSDARRLSVASTTSRFISPTPPLHLLPPSSSLTDGREETSVAAALGNLGGTSARFNGSPPRQTLWDERGGNELEAESAQHKDTGEEGYGRYEEDGGQDTGNHAFSQHGEFLEPYKNGDPDLVKVGPTGSGHDLTISVSSPRASGYKVASHADGVERASNYRGHVSKPAQSDVQPATPQGSTSGRENGSAYKGCPGLERYNRSSSSSTSQDSVLAKLSRKPKGGHSPHRRTGSHNCVDGRDEPEVELATAHDAEVDVRTCDAEMPNAQLTEGNGPSPSPSSGSNSKVSGDPSKATEYTSTLLPMSMPTPTSTQILVEQTPYSLQPHKRTLSPPGQRVHAFGQKDAATVTSSPLSSPSKRLKPNNPTFKVTFSHRPRPPLQVNGPTAERSGQVSSQDPSLIPETPLPLHRHPGDHGPDLEQDKGHQGLRGRDGSPSPGHSELPQYLSLKLTQALQHTPQTLATVRRESRKQKSDFIRRQKEQDRARQNVAKDASESSHSRRRTGGEAVVKDSPAERLEKENGGTDADDSVEKDHHLVQLPGLDAGQEEVDISPASDGDIVLVPCTIPSNGSERSARTLPCSSDFQIDDTMADISPESPPKLSSPSPLLPQRRTLTPDSAPDTAYNTASSPGSLAVPSTPLRSSHLPDPDPTHPYTNSSPPSLSKPGPETVQQLYALFKSAYPDYPRPFKPFRALCRKLGALVSSTVSPPSTPASTFPPSAFPSSNPFPFSSTSQTVPHPSLFDAYILAHVEYDRECQRQIHRGQGVRSYGEYLLENPLQRTCPRNGTPGTVISVSTLKRLGLCRASRGAEDSSTVLDSSVT